MKKGKLLGEPKTHEDGSISIRIQPIVNGFIVKSGGNNQVYFSDIKVAVEEIGTSIVSAFSKKSVTNNYPHLNPEQCQEIFNNVINAVSKKLGGSPLTNQTVCELIEEFTLEEIFGYCKSFGISIRDVSIVDPETGKIWDNKEE